MLSTCMPAFLCTCCCACTLDRLSASLRHRMDPAFPSKFLSAYHSPCISSSLLTSLLAWLLFARACPSSDVHACARAVRARIVALVLQNVHVCVRAHLRARTCTAPRHFIGV
eukprot:3693298-Pleurochrysis_carterae.AAC.2